MTTKILITGDSADAVRAIKETESALGKLGSNVPATAERFRQMGERIDAAGRQSKIALMSIGDVANLAGADTGMQNIIRNAAIATDAVGDLSGAFAAMSPFMLAAAAAGVGLAFVLTRLTQQSPQVQELNKKLQDLAKVEPAVQGLMDLAGVTEAQAKLALEAAANNTEYARKLQELSTATQEQHPFIAELTNKWNDFQSMLRGAGDTMIQLASITIGTGAALAEFMDKLKTTANVETALASAQDMFGKGTKVAYDGLKSLGNQSNVNATAQAKLNDVVKEAPKYTKDYTDQLNKQAEAAQRVKDAQDNILRGIVEKSLTPTSVTSEDMELAKLGKYQTKWDEFRRRLEAVAGGADASQFGEQFSSAFNKLGLSAEDAARKFKDFSLFADPKNLKLVDWNAMTEDIGQQLLGLVGKANLMKEGFNKAWASLSADQKKSLRELGIESAGDAKKVLAGTASNLIDPFTEKDNVKKFQDAGAGVVNSIKAGIMDKDAQKSWGEVPAQLIKTVGDYFTLSDTIKALQDAGKGIINQIAQGIKDNVTTLSDALTAAVMQAIADAASAAAPSGTTPAPAVAVPYSGPIQEFASGGYGVFSRGGYVKVDDGEGYMFTGRGGGLPRMGGGNGGVNVTLVYSPSVSLATQDEVNARIEPMLRRALGRINGRKT